MTDKNDAYHVGFNFGRFLHTQDDELDMKDIALATDDFLETMEGSIGRKVRKNDHFYAGILSGYTLEEAIEDE